MVRFYTLSAKLTNGLGALARFVPPLGAPLTFEPPTSAMPGCPPRASRNRWNRTDLESAIGQDPHEPDSSATVWPPTPVRA